MGVLNAAGPAHTVDPAQHGAETIGLGGVDTGGPTDINFMGMGTNPNVENLNTQNLVSEPKIDLAEKVEGLDGGQIAAIVIVCVILLCLFGSMCPGDSD